MVARWMTTSWSASLSKPGPGSTQMHSCGTPARMSTRAWSPRKPMISRMMGASSGRVKRLVLVGTLRAGCAESSVTERRVLAPFRRFQCMTRQPRPVSVASCTMAGSVNPLTSLRIETPSRAHRRATSAWRVSTEMIADGASARMPRTTGTTRSASTLGETGVAPGRVDSPPTSMMSAPSSSISRPRRTARSTSSTPSPSSRLPPSEKESGVTLRMPMTRGRASDSSCLPQRQTE